MQWQCRGIVGVRYPAEAADLAEELRDGAVVDALEGVLKLAEGAAAVGEGGSLVGGAGDGAEEFLRWGDGEQSQQGKERESHD